VEEIPMKKRVAAVAAVFLVLGAGAWNVYLARPSKPAVIPPIQKPDDSIPIATDAEPGDSTLVALPDLSRVDRSLTTLPGWRDPGFCLLVFGKREPKTRVWLVEDGDTLYVDRDGSGDFSDPAKAVPAVARLGDTPSSPHREWTYSVGELTPDGGREKHGELKVDRYQLSGEPMKYVISLCAFGTTNQRAGWDGIFSKDRETAPVIHFGGPVVAKSLRSTKLSAGEEKQELHLCVGTPGRGKGSFAYVAIDGVPWSSPPVVRIRWPEGSPATEDRFLLKKRC
jgi:hypothetical protein